MLNQIDIKRRNGKKKLLKKERKNLNQLVSPAKPG